MPRRRPRRNPRSEFKPPDIEEILDIVHGDFTREQVEAFVDYCHAGWLALPPDVDARTHAGWWRGHSRLRFFTTGSTSRGPEFAVSAFDAYRSDRRRMIPHGVASAAQLLKADVYYENEDEMIAAGWVRDEDDSGDVFLVFDYADQEHPGAAVAAEEAERLRLDRLERVRWFRQHGETAQHALQLARNEQAGDRLGLEVEWAYEQDIPHNYFDDPEDQRCLREGEIEVWWAYVPEPNAEEYAHLHPHLLASLSMITFETGHGPHDQRADPYVRVIEAELLGEAAAVLRERGDV